MGDWVNMLRNALPAEDFELFVMLLWSIWKTRNNCLFNKAKPDRVGTIEMAVVLWNEWLQHQVPAATAGSRQVSSVWVPLWWAN